jgi:hypothetical protein
MSKITYNESRKNKKLLDFPDEETTEEEEDKDKDETDRD